MLKSETGLSLISELIALAIIGIALMILASGISTSGAGVVVVDQRVHAEALARRQMEAIKAQTYSPNPTAVPYQKVSSSGNYTTTIAVSYWLTPTGPFQGTLPEADGELQWITVTVYSALEPNDPLYVLESYKGAR